MGNSRGSGREDEKETHVDSQNWFAAGIPFQ